MWGIWSKGLRCIWETDMKWVVGSKGGIFNGYKNATWQNGGRKQPKFFSHFSFNSLCSYQVVLKKIISNMTGKSTDSYWNNYKRKAYKHKYCWDSLITYLSIVQQIFTATQIKFF